MKTMYYVDKEGATQGPVTASVMLDLWRRGAVTDETLAAMEGDEDWLPLAVFEDVLRPRRVVTRVSVQAESQRFAGSFGWLAGFGGGVALLGVVVLVFFNVIVGGVVSGLGLLTVVAFKER